MRFSRITQFAVSLFLFFSTLVMGFDRGSAATSTRKDSIRSGQVWQRPSWISGDQQSGFTFDPTWKFSEGPAFESGEEVLASSQVDCAMTEKSVAKVSAGWTAKFFCEIESLLKLPLVKVKYLFRDGEVSGELLGTRLLWALGFNADRVYYYDRVGCFGCTSNPHQDRRIDSSTLVNAREFERVTIERKFPGKEIKIAPAPENGSNKAIEGFSFEELTTLLPTGSAARADAIAHREALKLFAVFVRHADNKPGNQAMYCSGKTNSAGGCDGEVSLLIHDLGLTFGSGFYDDWKASKAIFEHWDHARIWKNPAKCQGDIGLSSEKEMSAPLIKEDGRKFLVQLLRGFSAGEAGRARVTALFTGAHADQRYGTIEQWVETFYRKIDEIEFPMGPAFPNFSCP